MNPTNYLSLQSPQGTAAYPEAWGRWFELFIVSPAGSGIPPFRVKLCPSMRAHAGWLPCCPLCRTIGIALGFHFCTRTCVPRTPSACRLRASSGFSCFPLQVCHTDACPAPAFVIENLDRPLYRSALQEIALL